MKKYYASFVLLLAALGFSPSSWAFYSTMDTGDLLEVGKYRLGAESQFITNEDTGVNGIARFDFGFNEEANVRAELGFGTTDIHIGGYFKWVPIPDYENQPAIGLTTGLLFAQYEGETELSLRLHPIISKGFAVDFGKITPYASLPIGLRTYDHDTDVPVQLTLGSDLFFQEINLWHFKGEVGFDVSKAFTYLSIGASLDFDEENGISFR
jgi:hypothetical protein